MNVQVSPVRASGHQRGAVPGAVFAPGDTHAQVEQTIGGCVDHAAFSVLVPLVAAVDDGVAGLHVGGEGGDGLIDGGSGFDQDDDGAGLLKGEDEILGRVVAGERELAFAVGTIYRLVNFGGGAVEDGDGEAFLGDVEG